MTLHERQDGALLRAVSHFFDTRPGDLEGYGVKDAHHSAGLVSWAYLRNRLQCLDAFKTAPEGAIRALHRCVERMLEAGRLVEDRGDPTYRGKLYMPSLRTRTGLVQLSFFRRVRPDAAPDWAHTENSL